LEPLTKEIIIKGIRNQDKTILKAIYYTYFPVVKKIVQDNMGSEEDAKDVFQEAIIIIYRRIKEGNLEIHTTFKTYIYSICRFMWKKELAVSKENIDNLTVFLEYENLPDVNIDEYKKHKQYKLYQKHFRKLEKGCRKTLKMFLKNKSLQEIAEKLDLSYDYIRIKKRRCKEQLIRYIKEDSEYNRWK